MTNNQFYIVQCTQSNFDDAQYLVRMFCRVIDVDDKNYSIRTCSLDSTLKKRLDDIGASFWPEPAYAGAKTASRSNA